MSHPPYPSPRKNTLQRVGSSLATLTTQQSYLPQGAFPTLHCQPDEEICRNKAKEVRLGQVKEGVARQHVQNYTEQQLAAYFHERARACIHCFQMLTQKKQELSTQLEEATRRLQRLQKEYKRKVFLQESSLLGLDYGLVITAICASIFGMCFGIIGASRTLMANNLGYMETPVLAVLYACVFLVPPMVFKSFYSALDTEEQKQRYLWGLGMLNGCSITVFVILFSLQNAPPPATAGAGGLFDEVSTTLSWWEQYLPALSLMTQIGMEFTTTSLLLILVQKIQDKHRHVSSREVLQYTPEYLDQKAKVESIEANLGVAKRDLSALEGYFQEFEARKTACVTKAISRFHHYLRIL